LFYETRERMDEAIAREKQIKGGSRAKKMALIEAMNQMARPLCGLCVSDRPRLDPDGRNDANPVVATARWNQSRGHSTASLAPWRRACRRLWIASSQGLLAMTARPTWRARRARLLLGRRLRETRRAALDAP
jgi:hypothetical protein